jgi:hypothetical protein
MKELVDKESMVSWVMNQLALIYLKRKRKTKVEINL